MLNSTTQFTSHTVKRHTTQPRLQVTEFLIQLWNQLGLTHHVFIPKPLVTVCNAYWAWVIVYFFIFLDRITKELNQISTFLCISRLQ